MVLAAEAREAILAMSPELREQMLPQLLDELGRVCERSSGAALEAAVSETLVTTGTWLRECERRFTKLRLPFPFDYEGLNRAFPASHWPALAELLLATPTELGGRADAMACIVRSVALADEFGELGNRTKPEARTIVERVACFFEIVGVDSVHAPMASKLAAILCPRPGASMSTSHELLALLAELFAPPQLVEALELMLGISLGLGVARYEAHQLLARLSEPLEGAELCAFVMAVSAPQSVWPEATIRRAWIASVELPTRERLAVRAQLVELSREPKSAVEDALGFDASTADRHLLVQFFSHVSKHLPIEERASFVEAVSIGKPYADMSNLEFALGLRAGKPVPASVTDPLATAGIALDRDMDNDAFARALALVRQLTDRNQRRYAYRIPCSA